MLPASFGVPWQGNHDCHAGSEQKGEDATTALRRARFLRVKITETATGSVRLETRLPSQFVDGMATVIPQVSTMSRGNAAWNLGLSRSGFGLRTLVSVVLPSKWVPEPMCCQAAVRCRSWLFGSQAQSLQKSQ